MPEMPENRTLQDWLDRGKRGRTVTDTPPEPTTPKPDPWTEAPDSEWLAYWAQNALQAGRLDLGYHLIRLARLADSWERRPRLNQAWRHQAEASQDYPAELPVDDELERIERSLPVDQVVTATAPVVPVYVPNGRCDHATVPGAECHGVAYYDAAKASWLHMDTTLDSDHPARVPSQFLTS